MARALSKLTPDRVKHKATKPGVHSDGGGLALRVSSSTHRSWIWRYMLDGRAREMGLGSYPEVSLAEAREKAREARELKAKGQDPIEARAAERASVKAEAAKSVTFEYCAKAYIAAHRPSWRSAEHADQWNTTLEQFVYPTFGAVPVADVNRALVIKVLEAIWQEKTETANRIRGRIESILDWANARDYRSGENPARWRGHLENVFPARSKVRAVKHHAALPYSEVSAFVASLQSHKGLAARALEFTILTASRSNETRGAEWSEFDLDNALWTVPASRMKKGREHRVPLSTPVLKLLRGQQKITGGRGYVFPSPKQGKYLSEMGMLKLLWRMDRHDITVHGFRSTFRDWVEETTNYAGAVAEAALAHVVANKVEAAYRRGDQFEKRKPLMAAWGKFCTTPAVQASNVTPIGRRKAS